MVTGYWGAPNALKDYCEANYVVSYYFAEFFNTISSIPFFIQAVIGCYLTHKYATKEFRFKLCYFSLMFVGFGSFLFHATLQYRFQLLDAIPMLFCATAVNYCACTLHLPLGHTDWKLAIKFIIVLVVELIFYLGLKIWMIFILGFGLNIVSITYVMSRDHRDVIGVYWIYAVLLYYGGFMCWIVDQCLCDYVQRLHLHRFVCERISISDSVILKFTSYSYRCYYLDFDARNIQCMACLCWIWIVFVIIDRGDCSSEIPQETEQCVFVHCTRFNGL